MLLLVTPAFAHPGALPHLHSTDPLALGVVAFWILAAGALGYGALHRGRTGQVPARR